MPQQLEAAFDGAYPYGPRELDLIAVARVSSSTTSETRYPLCSISLAVHLYPIPLLGSLQDA